MFFIYVLIYILIGFLVTLLIDREGDNGFPMDKSDAPWYILLWIIPTLEYLWEYISKRNREMSGKKFEVKPKFEEVDIDEWYE